jgi:hypothetical protein
MEMFGPGIEPEEPAREEPFVAEIELTNGERWRGAFGGGSGEALVWILGEGLRREAPLDRVRSAAIGGRIDDTGWPGVEDRVLLANGDAVDGFIASIGELVRIEGTEGAVDIPLARITGVLLANPPSPAERALAWLADGSVVEAARVEVAVTGSVSLAPGDSAEGTVGVAATDLLAILLDPRAVGALSSLMPSAVTYPDERLWGSPPTAGAPGVLGAGAVDLGGPVRVRWDLARPAARLGATAVLPPAMWAWGDCEIIVRGADGTEMLRERLEAGRPEAQINVPLGGARSVDIEVSSGKGGPVQDRVVLERAMILWQ